MSDQGRYYMGSRERGGQDEDQRSGRSQSGSMFDYGSRGRGEESGRQDRGSWESERENLGWGRSSSHDSDRDQDRERSRHRDQQRGGGSWTSERENLGSGRSSGHDRNRDQDRQRDHDRGGGFMGRGRSDRDEHGQQGGGYGRDDRSGGLPVDETSRLIASNKVEGTAVYGSDGRKLGSIYNFMVDKVSGKVEYAVMSYGGILGMGQRYYPLPWRTLSYDTREGGYRIDLTEEDLRHAPSFDRETEPQFNDRYGDRVHGWYGLNR